MHSKKLEDQRRSGVSKKLDDIANHDLVFCFRIGGRGIHHVGVFYEGSVWHAQLEKGVMKQPLEDFLKIYSVEEVISYL